ncbi:MAG: alpha/beta hydrolase [Puniceicoccaceae bacterium]|nr:MAG: alpha/beta hydrolase [Puniceicoccaceae bacterium]
MHQTINMGRNAFRLVVILAAAPCAAFSGGWEAPETAILRHEENRPLPNWREEKVPEYELPDALRTSAGKKVTTAEDWEQLRRPEVLDLFRKYVYGQPLGDPDQMEFSVLQEDESAMEGEATLRRILIESTVASRTHAFELFVFLPNRATRPAPLLLLMNHRSASNADPTRHTKSDFWPAEQVVARGYGIASFQTGDLAPDDETRFRDGAIRLFEGEVTDRPLDAAMMLTAWAWGASRAMDYFEHDDAIDAGRVGVVGHSRGGKASILAAAEDRRIALAISNGSGSMGAALSRRAFGERIHNINRKSHWFNGIFKQYDHRENDLPVDQHMLIALIAPRAVYVSSSDEDLWADPRGEFLGLAHASPIYTLYGYSPVDPEAMPALSEPLHAGPRGYHIRPGRHNMTLHDWQRFMDFADQHFGNDALQEHR